MNPELPWYIQLLIYAGMLLMVFLQQKRTAGSVAGHLSSAIAPKLNENSDLLRQFIQDRTNENQFNQALVQRLWAENDSLKASLNSLQETVKAQSLQIRDGDIKSTENKRIIEDFVTESQSRAQDVRDLQAQVGEFRKVIDSQQGKITALESDVSGEKVKIASLEAQRDKLQGELDQVRTEADSLKGRVAALEKQHDVDVAEKDRLTAELEKKEARIKELENQVKDLEAKVTELQAKLDSQDKPSGSPEGSQP